MDNRKIYVEQYDESIFGYSEQIDPSNLFPDFESKPYTSTISDIIDVYISKSPDKDSNERKRLTPSPGLPSKSNHKLFFISEEKESQKEFIRILIDTLCWYGYRYYEINFYIKNLTNDELAQIKNVLRDYANINERENGWSINFRYDIKSNKDFFAAGIELQMKEITIPKPKRSRILDIRF